MRAFVIVAGLLAGAAPDTDATTRLMRAETEFAAGRDHRADAARARPHFRAAAADFVAVREAVGPSPGLYLCEGNAHLLAGDLPRAVIAYRLGLRLDPQNAGLKDAVAYARAQAGAATPPEARWRALVAGWPGWLAGLALYGGGTLVLGVGWFRRGTVRPGALAAALLGAGLLVVSTMRAHRERAELARPFVVIAAANVVPRQGNGLTYPPRPGGALLRGTEATLLARRGDWLQIELPDGAAGWVSASAVAAP